MAAEGDEGERRVGQDRALSPGAERPGEARREPQRERRRDEVGRREAVHRDEDDEAAQARAGEIGEIDAPEGAVALQEDAAEKHRARQKRRQRGEEDLEQLPFLRGIGDQEDRVEAELLNEEIGRDRQRPEQPERDARRDAPIAREPVLGDAHHRAGEAEAEHRQADDQRAEMRPAADREHAHDVDLQRDDGAGAEPDGEIERETALAVERDFVVRADRRRADIRRRDCIVHERRLRARRRAGAPSNARASRPRGGEAINCCACP